MSLASENEIVKNLDVVLALLWIGIMLSIGAYEYIQRPENPLFVSHETVNSFYAQELPVMDIQSFGFFTLGPVLTIIAIGSLIRFVLSYRRQTN